MKTIKSIVIVSLAVVSLHFISQAGYEHGNGGGVVVCKKGLFGLNKTIELLDFYEAKALRNTAIDMGDEKKPWKNQIQFVLQRLRPRSELRFQLYSRWLETFEKESLFMKGAQFTNVEDTQHVAIPKHCEFGQAAVQKKPKFQNDPRYYINDDLWKHMSEKQRAGLVLHELIYREAIGYGHDFSDYTRFFLAKIASPEITSMDDEAFYNLIKEVHFEQTDLPLPGGDGITSIRLKRFYNPSDFEKDPGTLDLEGRVVAQVGQCQGLSCETFLTGQPNSLNFAEYATNLQQCSKQEHCIPKVLLSRDFLSYNKSGILFVDSNFVDSETGAYDPNVSTMNCESESPWVRRILTFRNKVGEFSSFDASYSPNAPQYIPTGKCELLRVVELPGSSFRNQFVAASEFREIQSHGSNTAWELNVWDSIFSNGIKLQTEGDLESEGSSCRSTVEIVDGNMTRFYRDYFSDKELHHKTNSACRMNLNGMMIDQKNEIPGFGSIVGATYERWMDFDLVSSAWAVNSNKNTISFYAFNPYISESNANLQLYCEAQFTTCLTPMRSKNPVSDGLSPYSIELNASARARIFPRVKYENSSSDTEYEFKVRPGTYPVNIVKHHSEGYRQVTYLLTDEDIQLPSSETTLETFHAGDKIWFNQDSYASKTEWIQ